MSSGINSKKRKDSSSQPSSSNSMDMGKMDEFQSPPKRAKHEEEENQNEMDVDNQTQNATSLNSGQRPLLKTSLKQKPKPLIFGMESTLSQSSDTQESIQKAAGWQPRNGEKKGEMPVAPEARFSSSMSNSLRSSLRGSTGIGSQKNVSKITLKSHVSAPVVPENHLEQLLDRLIDAVKCIHQRTSISMTLEDLYTSAEGLSAASQPAPAYERLEKEFRAHLAADLTALLDSSKGVDDTQFMILFNNMWTEYCQHTTLIRSIFLSLDRKLMTSSNSIIRPVLDLALWLFRILVAEVKEVDVRLRRGFLASIERDRNSESVDRYLIKSLSRMWVSLGMYDDNIEPIVLESTTNYYREESIRKTSEISIAAYINHVIQRLEFEENTIGLYLTKSTLIQLLNIVQQELIKRHLEFLSGGFSDLLDKDDHDSIKSLFKILSLVSELKTMRNTWKLYIQKRGTAIVNDKSKDKTMIEDLMAFRSRIDAVLEVCFLKDGDFAFSLKGGFEDAINSRLNAPSELLAKFMNRHLQAGSTASSSDAEFDALFSKVMLIFRALDSKDVFEAFYRKDLAKRLLMQKIGSIDAEKSVLSKLKDECGAPFISKMEGMFKDMELSKSLTEKFGEYLKQLQEEFKSKMDVDEPASAKDSYLDPNDEQSNPAPKLTQAAVTMMNKVSAEISVLTTPFWPTYQKLDVTIPTDLSTIQSTFSQFYLKQFNNRNLVWLNFMGQATLRAFFPAARREVSVSLFQATVLLLFNESPTLSFSAIKETSGISNVDELKRTLLSLMSPFAVLLSSSSSSTNGNNALTNTKDNGHTSAANTDIKIISENDIFAFNNKFTSTRTRFKIPTIPSKEATKTEEKQTNEHIFQQRQGQVDAAIVRIMKTRKMLSHNDLIAEVIALVKFPLQTPDIKKRIDVLIEREYLGRDPDDQSIYHYRP